MTLATATFVSPQASRRRALRLVTASSPSSEPRILRPIDSLRMSGRPDSALETTAGGW
jgi:hypothetical protein